MNRSRPLLVLLLAALAAWCVACVTVLVDDRFAEFVDSAIYLLTAKSLATGHGYTYLDEPFFVRPPGTSVLLLPFVGQPWDHHLINTAMQALAVGAFGAVALAMSRLHGAVIGVLIALLFAVNRLTLNVYNAVLSELPFVLAFYLSAWLLLPDREGRPPSLRRGLAGAVLLGLACYIRTLGLLALPGLVLAGRGAARTPRARGALLAAIALGLHLPWLVWSGHAAATAEGPATHLLMHDYATALLHVDPGDPDSPLVGPSGYLARLLRHVPAFSQGVAEDLVGSHAPPLPLILGGLAFAAIAWSWWSRRSLLDWFTLAYLALLLLYFTFADRLLLPMIPLLLSAMIHGVYALAEASGRPRALGHALVAVLAVGTLLVSATHAQTDLSPHPRKVLNSRIDGEIARWLREETPPDTVAMHERGPILSVLGDRRVYSCRNVPGDWPGEFPEVDWIILTPGQFEFEPSVAAAALETRPFDVQVGRQVFRHVMYRMRAPR